MIEPTDRRTAPNPGNARRALSLALTLVVCAGSLVVAGGMYFRSRGTVEEITAISQGLHLLRLEREMGFAAGEAELDILWAMYTGDGEGSVGEAITGFRSELDRTSGVLSDLETVEAWVPVVRRLADVSADAYTYLDAEHTANELRLWMEAFPERYSGIFPSDPRGRWSALLGVVLGSQYSIYSGFQYAELALSRHAYLNGETPQDEGLISLFTAKAGSLEQLGITHPDAFSPFEEDLDLGRAAAADPVIGQIVADLRSGARIRRIEGDFDYLVGRSRVPWFEDTSEILSLTQAASRELDDAAEDVLVRAEDILAVAQISAVRSGRAALAAGLAAFGLGTILLSLLSRIRQKEEVRLRSVAETDALTGIHNRFALYEREQRRLRDPDATSIALLQMDLDHFKQINDRYGHAVGDAALIAFAQVCRSVVREASDTLARIGGDEFVIVLHGLMDPSTEAEAVAERIRTLLEQPFDLGGHQLMLKSSVGIAVTTEPAELESLLHQADVALLEAKKTKQNRATVFERNLHGNLIHEIEEALEQGLVLPVFQPIVRATNHLVAGFEVFARWTREDGSVVPPESFMRVLQALGITSRWLRRILEHIAEIEPLLDAEFKGRFWINVSLADLVATGDDAIPALFAASGVPLERLGVEVTERVCRADLGLVRETLQQLREAGVQVALDDLGSDGVPLRHLLDLPLDRVKLDGGLIRGLEKSESVRHIVQGLFAIAVHLKLQIVAEQIETPEEQSTLIQLGVTYLQGNLLGAAVPHDQVVAIVRAGHVQPLHGVA